MIFTWSHSLFYYCRRHTLISLVGPAGNKFWRLLILLHWQFFEKSNFHRYRLLDTIPLNHKCVHYICVYYLWKPNIIFKVWYDHIAKQDCIPAWCVPVHCSGCRGGVCFKGGGGWCLPRGVSAWGCLPWEVSAWGVSARWVSSPGGVVPWGCVYPSMHWRQTLTPPREQNDWQTLQRHYPWPQLRCGR